MTVIAYQLVIVFTLIGVRLLRSKLFLAAAWGWTAFSVINLFYPPLLFLQLAVVWGTYFLLRPRHQFTSPSLLGPSQPRELESDTPRAKLQAGKQDLEEEARADEGFVGSLNSLNRELESILEATRLSNRKLNICSPIRVQTTVIETKFKLADLPTDAKAKKRALSPDILEELRARMARQAEAERNENPEDDKSTGSLLKINRDRREALSQLDAYDAETKQALTDAFYAEVENQAQNFRAMASRLEADQDLSARFADLMASTKGGAELFLAVVAGIDNPKVLESDIATAQDEMLSDILLEALLEDVNASLKGTESKESITDSSGLPPPGMREEGSAFIEEPFSHDLRHPFDSFLEGDDREHNHADFWIGREREDIEETALELDIPFLVHFTRGANLPSIMKYGLIPVSTGRQSGIRQEVNDHNRWDRHRNATSLSIGFPNYQMFYKYRQLNPDIDWAILLLRPRILWQRDCAFCRHNAADRRIRNSDIGDLKSAAAFRGMFNEDDTLSARSVERLERYDPTDPQAEVLVFGAIPPREITGVVFESDETAQRHSQAVGKKERIVSRRQSFFSVKGDNLFESRRFARKYGK